MSRSARSDRLVVGYVSRAHGLAGEVAVRTHDPDSIVLAEVPRVWIEGPSLEGRSYPIEKRRRALREWLFRLQGVNGREAAQPLKGTTVSVFREDLPPAQEGEGEYFQGDLVGLTAIDAETGKELGVVEEIWSTGPVPNLVIRDATQTELIVPFADDFVGEIDVRSRRVVIKPPRYLE